MSRMSGSWCLRMGLAAASVLLCSCVQMSGPNVGDRAARGEYEMTIETECFGKMPDGEEVQLFKLVNANGLRADVANYGAIVVRLLVPDRDRKLDDVVLGYDKLADYVEDTPYFGAVVGRYGNRIAKGRFTLDGVEYKLATNNGENHLHGGLKGFDKVVWDAEPCRTDDAVGVKLVYVSKDGEEGYPGNLTCMVIYSLTNDNELKIEYGAETDKATPINLTHHGYWNLGGQGKCDILGHELMLNASRFTPIDKGLIPTGERRPVKGTPFDFTKPAAIGSRINTKENEQIEFGGGYDHNFVLDKGAAGNMSPAARVYEPTTGRVMEIRTVEPGIQFYSGNFLDGQNVGKGNLAYNHRYGFCLETQHFPDSPNKPAFPSVILRPGQKYRTTTIYSFSAK